MAMKQRSARIDGRVVPVAAFHRLADRCDDRLSIAACFGEIGLLADVCAGGPGGDCVSEYASG